MFGQGFSFGTPPFLRDEEGWIVQLEFPGIPWK